MIILIKLIAAHLLGDFVLQSDKLCKMKYGKSLSTRLYALGLHSFIQAILSYLFVAEWSNFTLPIVIGVSHFCIDWLKMQTGKKGLIPLIVDQIFHYLVLFVIYWANQSYGGCLYYSYNSSYLLPVWLVTTSFIAVLSPTSILIKAFIDYENWLPKDASLQGLPNAGKWIGYLERILILTFIFTHNVEGIGFLLAAKSVFRFGELNQSKDIKVTEYVLIGTFASFSVAIIIGFAAKYMITLNP